MQRIIKAIEEKLKSQEDTIAIRDWEIVGLKEQLAKAEKTIEEQAHIISDLRGEIL
jgi:hypothetical protein